jgi:cysteine-rich repeat protein
MTNAAAGEACDQAGETAACDADCTPAECGDMVTNVAADEECDDGNGMPGDGCEQCLVVVACSGGAVMLAENPAGDMVVCDDPTNTVCEQDAETLCPVGWGLCTREQHINRNTGFDVIVGVAVVGEIHCRTGGGAGHYTIGGGNLNQDLSLNCDYGSSRESCETGYGCNEQFVSALCCAPTPSCGDGVVNAPEELCDDANASEVDECLNSCGWRVPGNHGFGNCS